MAPSQAKQPKKKKPAAAGGSIHCAGHAMVCLDVAGFAVLDANGMEAGARLMVGAKVVFENASPQERSLVEELVEDSVGRLCPTVSSGRDPR